jgi:prepilin-type N-terminal cleavage/methylation domain-containing protein
MVEQRGFSLIELLVVVSIIVILTTVAMFSLSKNKQLYKTDDQALQVIDMLQEARFRALSQREVMRVEINMALGKVRIIDENLPGDANDDRVIRTLILLSPSDVKMSGRPTGFTATPATPITCPDAIFGSSQHPLSAGNQVAVFRFNMLGQVLNSGDNATGQNAAVTNSTVVFWPPNPAAPTQALQPGLIRAITVMGNAGAIQYWKYNGSQFVDR